MAATKRTSQGTILRYRPNGSVDATAWKILHSATEHGTEASVEPVDITSHSTLGNYKEYIPENIAEPGEFTASCFFEPNITSPAGTGEKVTNGAHFELMSSIGLGTIYECHLTYPMAGANPTSHAVAPPTDRSHETFTAFVTSVAKAHPIEGRATLEFTFKRTGTPVINPVV